MDPQCTAKVPVQRDVVFDDILFRQYSMGSIRVIIHSSLGAPRSTHIPIEIKARVRIYRSLLKRILRIRLQEVWITDGDPSLSFGEYVIYFGLAEAGRGLIDPSEIQYVFSPHRSSIATITPEPSKIIARHIVSALLRKMRESPSHEMLAG